MKRIKDYECTFNTDCYIEEENGKFAVYDGEVSVFDTEEEACEEWERILNEGRIGKIEFYTGRFTEDCYMKSLPDGGVEVVICGEPEYFDHELEACMYFDRTLKTWGC